MFHNKTVVVTGGARGIGKCICDEFKKAGANVCVIDLLENPYFVSHFAALYRKSNCRLQTSRRVSKQRHASI